MPQTPDFNLPYPALTDPPDGPAQLQALAEAVEAAINQAVADALADVPIITSGVELVSFSTATSHVRTIQLGVTLDAAPEDVHVNIRSGDGSVNGWIPRSDTYGTTSFRLIMTGPSSAWSNIPVVWTAFSPRVAP
jgi:hypothetical protein